MHDSHGNIVDHDAILRTLPGLVLVVGRDKRVVYCNRPLAAQTAEEVVGQSILDVTPVIYRQRVSDRLDQIFMHGNECVLEEQWIAGSKGTRQWFENTFCPVSRDGEVVGAMLISNEITARKEADEKVRGMRQQLEYAQELAHVGSWSWEIGSREVSWSRELYRAFGLEEGAPITLDQYFSSIHPADLARVKALVERSAIDRRPAQFEHRIVRPDRSERLLRCRLFVSPGANGRHWMMYGTAQDITRERSSELERERLYHNAEAAIQARDAFLSMAAHELKTPLTTLRLYLDATIGMILHNEAEPAREKIVTRLESAKRQASRVVSLLEVLLEVPDLLSRDLDLVREETDLAEVVPGGRQVRARLQAK